MVLEAATSFVGEVRVIDGNERPRSMIVARTSPSSSLSSVVLRFSSAHCSSERLSSRLPLVTISFTLSLLNQQQRFIVLESGTSTLTNPAHFYMLSLCIILGTGRWRVIGTTPLLVMRLVYCGSNSPFHPDTIHLVDLVHTTPPAGPSVDVCRMWLLLQQLTSRRSTTGLGSSSTGDR